jgi:hypothetical protein
VPGAWLTSRLGPRRAALWTVALSRQSFLPLVALPWLPVDAAASRTILVVVAGAHHALGILCNNAWVSWAGELVPERIRGRYFGRRTAVCTLASASASLLVGSALDRGEAARIEGPMLAAVTAVACAAGAVSVVLMAQQGGGLGRRTWSLSAATRPLVDAGALRLGRYLVAWNAAVGFSAPFFGLYVLRDLGGGFQLLALYGAVAAGARTVTSSGWGRVVDRAGAHRVLVATTFGLALAPCAWLAAARVGPWILVAEAAVGGALLAGHAVATFTLPLSLAPADGRSHYHAAFSTAGGVAFGVAAAAASHLAEGAGAAFGADERLSPLQLTLLASLAARGIAAAASLGVVAPPARAYRQPRWTTRRAAGEAAAGILARSYAVGRGLRWTAPGTSRSIARAAGSFRRR